MVNPHFHFIKQNPPLNKKREERSSQNGTATLYDFPSGEKVPTGWNLLVFPSVQVIENFFGDAGSAVALFISVNSVGVDGNAANPAILILFLIDG